MLEQMLIAMRREEHARDLMGEAERERLLRRDGLRRSLQCRLCLRLGRALMALGQRLAARGRRADLRPAEYGR